MDQRGDAVARTVVIVCSILAVAGGAAWYVKSSTPPTKGTLTGTLQATGAQGAGAGALSGTVTIRGSNGDVGVIEVGTSGHFTMHPPVGTYTVTGQSPQYGGGTATCEASGRVTVTKGVTSTVAVDCPQR